MAGKTEESAVGQYYDHSRNQLPYGGATDIHGRIVWAVTKEEHDRLHRVVPGLTGWDRYKAAGIEVVERSK